jgi:hypothetical protein
MRAVDGMPGNKAVQPGPLALASLKAPVGLVDDVNAAFAPYQPVIAVAAAQRFQGITDFHDRL